GARARPAGDRGPRRAGDGARGEGAARGGGDEGRAVARIRSRRSGEAEAGAARRSAEAERRRDALVRLLTSLHGAARPTRYAHRVTRARPLALKALALQLLA